MNVWNEFWRIFSPPPTTTTTSTNTSSSSLSNYIIIFLSIKIRMNNLNVWQQPGAEKRKVFCSAAGRQGCVWWAMHAKLTLLWWEKKEEKRRSKTIKKKKHNPLKKISPPVKFERHDFRSVTQKHIGRYEIFNKVAAGCSRWKHAALLANSRRSGARFMHFNL